MSALFMSDRHEFIRRAEAGSQFFLGPCGMKDPHQDVDCLEKPTIWLVDELLLPLTTD